MFDHPDFKHCTLYVSGAELRTDGQMEVRRPLADLSGLANTNGEKRLKKFLITSWKENRYLSATGRYIKLEPQGALIAHLSTKSTSVIS